MTIENPLDTLAAWADEAESAGLASPRTLTFATVGADGAPHARIVLSTVIDSQHVRFHSSRPTAKTRDIAENPRASAVFYWPDLSRQVILHGTATELDEATSRVAYPTRPRQLQLVAWAYDDVLTEVGVLGAQATPPEETTSRTVASDVPTSTERIAASVAHHGAQDPATLPMPGSWTTIAFVPDRVDLWQGVGPEVAAHKARYDKGADGTWQRSEILP
ncbi:pyridoxine/pyridoxamine 5'-phosphate oxidase [Sanguibacter antarcticus]|uniref:Pyridoxamine 5'-phosphate oxidase n=1 Tax=Sanguibacter antarcticus TaxID=372484 RepID=A0A2A9E7Y2_9MICO|nr:pyridoxamine 5'-phosphate oxidase family protein [Sanguibacter antarcticus]PFG34415.1 pyridoxamine 5'-phosphate oxidase [Sanguibacter antarcticus]